MSDSMDVLTNEMSMVCVCDSHDDLRLTLDEALAHVKNLSNEAYRDVDPFYCEQSEEMVREAILLLTAVYKTIIYKEG